MTSRSAHHDEVGRIGPVAEAPRAPDVVVHILVFVPDNGLRHHDFTADEHYIGLLGNDDDVPVLKGEIRDVALGADHDDALGLHLLGTGNEIGQHFPLLWSGSALHRSWLM